MLLATFLNFMYASSVSNVGRCHMKQQFQILRANIKGSDPVLTELIVALQDRIAKLRSEEKKNPDGPHILIINELETLRHQLIWSERITIQYLKQ